MIRKLIGDYRHRRVSPPEVLAAAVDRADESQRTINAFVTICRDEASAEAKAAEGALSSGDTLPPLTGVPITVKDVIPTKGIRTTFGSSHFAHNVPAVDAISVARLRQSGAIIIGKTTTPEGACKQTTNSALSGITRNPWALELTPGGSGGGSSAATACGIGYASLVTDGGGSARLPAACTGIVGLKPTFGRIPVEGAADAFGGLAHMGVMARTVADAALVFRLAAGGHPSDPYSLSGAATSSAVDGGERSILAGLRVGWRARLENELIDPPILRLVRCSLDVLEQFGARVEPITGDLVAPLPIWQTLQNVIWASRWGGLVSEGATLDPVIVKGVGQARELSALELQVAIHGRTALFRQVQSWFEECDVIVSPTLTRLPLTADHPGMGDIEVAGKNAGEIREAWAPMLGLFTLTGHPALSMNCGWTAEGLPVGLHLVGRWHGDDFLLRVASALESALPEARLGAGPARANSFHAKRVGNDQRHARVR